MPETSADVQKPKRDLPRQWGCFKYLLIPILLYLTCYGSLWLFARYGGEWVMRDQILIPPDSQQIKRINDEKGLYTYKTEVYFHRWTPPELREWFTKNGVGLTPTRLTQSVFDPEDYYINIWTATQYSAISTLHHMSANLASSWRDDVNAECRELKVYKSASAFLKDYPDMMLPDGMSAFEATICWPNVK